MPLSAVLAPLVDLIYPLRCPLCGEAVSGGGAGGAVGLCLACWNTLEFAPADGAISAGVLYNQTARDLVLAFKRGGRMALAPMLARMIHARLAPLHGHWLIVPVPLHPIRLWQRGYNQSALLARELATLAGGELLVDGLRRVRATPRLGRLGREQRRAVLAGAIAAHMRRTARLRHANILLVDDVYTTGATTEACRAALVAAGAREIRIACFARVAPEGRG